jgi:hypothetical protein
MPTASAAIEIRPPSRICIAFTNPWPFLTQAILVGHETIFEDYTRRFGSTQPEFVLFLCRRKALHSLFKNEAVMPLLFLARSLEAKATQVSP